MKRFWLLAAALFLLWLDILIPTGKAYPEYEPNENYGRRTQVFIMEDVVGDVLPVDVVSDIPGLLILLVLTIIGGPAVVPTRVEEANGKRTLVSCGKRTRLGSRDWKKELSAVLLCLVSVGNIIVMRCLPLWTNGVACFGGEYWIRLLDIFAPLMVVYYVMAEWIQRTDIRTTHRETDVSALLMMVSLFAGFFARFADLYQFPFIHTVAWLLEGFFMVFSLGILRISLRENGRKLGMPDVDDVPLRKLYAKEND